MNGLELVAATVKLASDHLTPGAAPGGVRLVPSLVFIPRTKGFNLQLKNIGKEVAYGVQVAVRAAHLAPGCHETTTKSGNWDWDWSWPGVAYRLLVSALEWVPGLNHLLRGAKWYCSEDVGLVLAPGEQVQIYFGSLNEESRLFPDEYFSWEEYARITLQLRWFEGPPRRFSRRQRATVKLVVHCWPGSAHTAWSVKPKSRKRRA